MKIIDIQKLNLIRGDYIGIIVKDYPPTVCIFSEIASELLPSGRFRYIMHIKRMAFTPILIPENFKTIHIIEIKRYKLKKINAKSRKNQKDT
jgi:hypothetical protein